MRGPKTKPQVPPPKILQRSVRTLKGQISLKKSMNNFRKTKQVIKRINESDYTQPQHNSPEQYATERSTELGGRVAHKIGGEAASAAKKGAKKGYEKVRERHQVSQREKANSTFADDIKNHQPHSDLQARGGAQKPSRQAPSHSSKIRPTQQGKQTVKNATIYTGNKANRTAKIAKKGVRNTRRTVKTARKGVKTASRTAKRTAKAAKRAAVIAKKVAVMAAKTVKLTMKAIIAAVKVAVAAVKTLIAVIAAGGWIVVVVIIIIAVIAAIVSSPLAIFSNDSDGTTPTISEVVQEINDEYANKITGIIADAGNVDEVIIEGETASSDYTVGNWIDVLGVFSVKSTVTTSDEEFVPLVYMEDQQISELKDVFWSMNVISHEIVTETVETDSSSSTSAPSASPTPEPTPRTIRKLVISIDCKTYEQGAELYGFSDEKTAVLDELMQPDYLPMFMEICGMDSYTGLTPEQLQALIGDLPEGELSSVIVQYAVSRLGDPYSKAKRGQGSYVDCSYFARWCYQQAGVADFTAPTAASQAKYCVDNGVCVSYKNLQPGDLIFWSFKKNGRYMNISHVGIYAGDGYVIDASSSRGMVVYRPVFSESSIVVCGRPHVLSGT